MELSKKEIESVSKLEPLERYKYFIKRVADFQKLYSLIDKGNWAIAEINNYKLFSLWSATQYAENLKEGEWQDYDVVEFSLEFFEESLIPLIKDNNYLLNVFSVSNKTGFVIDIEEFLNDLEDELANYE